MLNLENKTYVIMGIANKRSIAFGVAKVLDQLGAKGYGDSSTIPANSDGKNALYASGAYIMTQKN
ncbi:hypothetical protein ACQKIL_04760, partial [Staphylococcus aureus]